MPFTPIHQAGLVCKPISFISNTTQMSFLYLIPGIRQLQTKLNQLTSYVPPPPRLDKDCPRKVLLVHAHPDPLNSYSAAIAQQVEHSAGMAGHEVRRISLYASSNSAGSNSNTSTGTTGYAPQLTRQEHAMKHARGTDLDQRQVDPVVKDHIRLMQWCDTIIFVYPTWWMNTPAVLKGFFDRSLVHDICWSLPDPSSSSSSTSGATGLVPKLTNITQIVGISTYGAPFFIVTAAGDNGRRMIANAIRPILSPHATVTWLGLYGMDETTHVQRRDFLQQVDALVRGL